MADHHPLGVHPARRCRERGSVLMLMPAAVLIVIVLGAIAVDRAVVFGAQRDLVATAQAAADDGAAAIDLAALRADGVVRIDRAAVDRAVAAATAAARADGSLTVTWSIQGDDVVVRLERRVALVFSGGVPGTAPDQMVRATARSSLVRR